MGMILNPDKESVKYILDRIKANNGYCPCTLVENEDTKCKCKEMREQNICHCNLYVEEVK